MITSLPPGTAQIAGIVIIIKTVGTNCKVIVPEFVHYT
jgi:hypothetical protein